MNKKRLAFLADWFEAGAPHTEKVDAFDIRVGVQVADCGTVCCIAGAATQFFNDEDGSIVGAARLDFESRSQSMAGEAPWKRVFDEARDLLDLTFNQARTLFMPTGIDFDFKSIFPENQQDWSEFNDPARVARILRHFISTKEIDWTIK